VPDVGAALDYYRDRLGYVEALHAELLERGADLLYGPVDQAYGLREIRARDPHGYILAFGKLPE
jgi:hypothetical protein